MADAAGSQGWLSLHQDIIILHIVTIFLRLYVVTNRDSWWILHPDEVFQSLEGSIFFLSENKSRHILNSI